MVVSSSIVVVVVVVIIKNSYRKYPFRKVKELSPQISLRTRNRQI